MHTEKKWHRSPKRGGVAAPPVRRLRRAPEGEPSDWHVLQAWRAGDSAAGEVLLQRHIGPLRRFFRRKVSNPAAVVDLIAQTLLVCARAGDPTQGTGAFRSLLYSSATNILRRDIDQEPARNREPGDWARVAPRAARRLVFDQSLWLPATVRGLPLDQRAVLELSYLEELEGPQIAALLGMPTCAVYQHLQSGTQHLRAVMTEFTRLPMPAVCSEYAHDDHVMLAA